MFASPHALQLGPQGVNAVFEDLTNVSDRCYCRCLRYQMDDSVDSTVRIIEDAELPHPYPALLSSFVTEALDPRFAARYIRERRLVEGWEAIVADWTYIIDCGTHRPRPEECFANELCQ